MQRQAHTRKAVGNFLAAVGTVADIACKRLLGVYAAKLGSEADAVGDQAARHRRRDVHPLYGAGHPQLVLRHGLVDTRVVELHHRLPVAVVVARGIVSAAAFLIVVEADRMRLVVVHQAKSLVKQADKLLKRQSLGQFEQRSRQTAIVPLNVLLAAGGVETAPQLVANQAIVASNGADVRQFVAYGHNLAVAVGSGKLVKLHLLLATPIQALVLWCRFVLDKCGHTVAKLAAYLLDGDVRILDYIVKDGCRQHLLVVGDGGDDGCGLHRVDDVGEALAATLGAAMGLDSEAGCAVE